MIDIEKFICSLLADHPVGVTVREDIHKALKDQGLEYKGGKIVPIEDKTELKESEGERIRKMIINTLNRDKILTEDEFYDCVAWLEKQGEQGTNGNEREIPNSTWSEEDEVGLGEAMWAIKQARTIAKDENDMGNLWYAERWLKSLKERYTWKPSDKQIDVVKSAALDVAKFSSRSEQLRLENEPYYKALVSLCNDLEKLREE